MVAQEIIDYILQAQKHGLSDFEIKQNLLSAGWEAAAVEDSFVYARAAENKSQISLDKPASSFSHTPSLQARPETRAQNLQPLAAQRPNLPAAHPSLNISEQNFAKTPRAGTILQKKLLLWILSLAGVLVAAGGAYAYYAFIYVTPAKIWTKLWAGKPEPGYHNQFFISYSSPIGDATSTNAVLTFKNEADFGAKDASGLKTSGTAAISSQGEGGDYTTALNYVIINNLLYLEVGQISALKNLSGETDWIKIDPQSLSDFFKTLGGGAKNYDSLSNYSALKSRLADIWQKAAIIKPTNFLKEEILNGQPTYHIKAEVDKPALSQAIFDYINAITLETSTGADTAAKPFTDAEKQNIKTLIGKLEIKQLDFWAGKNDFRLYKFSFISSAPSFKDFDSASLSADIGPLTAVREKSRDAQRLADARRINSLLEMYANDNGGYPEAVSGKPRGIESKYINVLPEAPTPADGSCSEFSNTYWYTPIGSARSINGIKVYPNYQFKFCLGQATGGFLPGWAIISPAGVQSGLPCGASAEHCQKTLAPKTDATAAINSMSFDAELKIESAFSDYGKAVNVQAPAESTDILELIKTLLSSAGASVQSSVSTSTPALK